MVIGLELKMGTRAGTMTLCFPFNVIEPVMGKLATQSWLAYQHRARPTTSSRTSPSRSALPKLTWWDTSRRPR